MESNDRYITLAIYVIKQALIDAQDGNIEAQEWLTTTGASWVEILDLEPGTVAAWLKQKSTRKIRGNHVKTNRPNFNPRSSEPDPELSPGEYSGAGYSSAWECAGESDAAPRTTVYPARSAANDQLAKQPKVKSVVNDS